MHEKFVSSVEANQHLQQQAAQKDAQIVAAEESSRAVEAANSRVVDELKVHPRTHTCTHSLHTLPIRVIDALQVHRLMLLCLFVHVVKRIRT